MMDVVLPSPEKKKHFTGFQPPEVVRGGTAKYLWATRREHLQPCLWLHAAGVCRGGSHAPCLKGKKCSKSISKTRADSDRKKSNEYFTGRECRAALQVTLWSLSESHRARPRRRHVSDCLSAACRWVPPLPACRLHQDDHKTIMLEN